MALLAEVLSPSDPARAEKLAARAAEITAPNSKMRARTDGILQRIRKAPEGE